MTIIASIIEQEEQIREKYSSLLKIKHPTQPHFSIQSKSYDAIDEYVHKTAELLDKEIVTLDIGEKYSLHGIRDKKTKEAIAQAKNEQSILYIKNTEKLEDKLYSNTFLLLKQATEKEQPTLLFGITSKQKKMYNVERIKIAIPFNHHINI